MGFSILHISDLHRNLSGEIGNDWLIDSFEKDFNQFEFNNPVIEKPTLCIASGDLVYRFNRYGPWLM